MTRLAVALLTAMTLSGATRKHATTTTEHVREYTRKDGTVVAAHERAKPAAAPLRSTAAPKPEPVHESTRCSTCARDDKGRIARSAAAKRQYERSVPCPATGKRSGACPGFVIDHVWPLACGGADSPTNMAWQTVAEAKAKDRIERAGCR